MEFYNPWYFLLLLLVIPYAVWYVGNVYLAKFTSTKNLNTLIWLSR